MNVTLLNTINLDDGTFIKKGGVKLNNQEKTVDIRENGTITVVPDKDFTGLNKVSVNVNVGEDLLADAIRFLDYDGTILYTYSPSEIEEMTELPPLPSHDGLICQEWNYTLDEIKKQPLFCEIGATYITDNGDTRIKASFTESDNTLELYVKYTGGDLFVNWGDGSETQKCDSYQISHQFSPGDYTISLHPEDSTTIELGMYDSWYYQYRTFIGAEIPSSSEFRSKINYSVRAIYLGRNIVNVAKHELGICDNLAEITIPNSLDQAFPIRAGKLTGLVYPRNFKAFSTYISTHEVPLFRYSAPVSAAKASSASPSIGVARIERMIHPYDGSYNSRISYVGRGGYVTDVDYGCGSNNVGHFDKITTIPSRIAVIGGNIPMPTQSAQNLILQDEAWTQASAFPYAGKVWILKDKKLHLLSSPLEITLNKSSSQLYKLPISEVTFTSPLTTVPSMQQSAYLKRVIIEEGVTTISYDAFRDVSSLSTVLCNSSLITEIPSSCFSGCTQLTKVILPPSLKTIQDTSFQYCRQLSNIDLPNTLSTIGQSAFFNCVSLESVTIPDSVTSIGNYAFSDCSNLKAFYGKFASADNRCLIIDGVLHSFAGAGMSTYYTPTEVTSIGSYAFAYNVSTKEVIINEGVTTIEPYAFAYSTCREIKMPSTLVSIQSNAFKDSYKQIILDFSSHTTIPTIEASVFGSNARPPIIVPDSLYDEWRVATNWSKFASYIRKKSDWDAQNA